MHDLAYSKFSLMHDFDTISDADPILSKNSPYKNKENQINKRDCDSCETKETKQQKHPCTYKDEFKYFTLGVL